MNMLCRRFWHDDVHNVESCEQCRLAWEDAQRDCEVEADGPWYQRSEDEVAGLDCRGAP